MQPTCSTSGVSVPAITVQNVSNEGPLIITQFHERITPIRRIKHWAILRNDPKLGLGLPDNPEVFLQRASNVQNLPTTWQTCYKAPKNMPSFLSINGMFCYKKLKCLTCQLAPHGLKTFCDSKDWSYNISFLPALPPTVGDILSHQPP